MNSPNTTIISHFYNEEFLLPFWLNHHKRLFNNGIMIDYDSTDNSVEIIKQICPHWKIVKSRNKEFDAFACDAEVMDYEKGISGWKMVLNTTEFLIVSDFEGYLTVHNKTKAMRGNGVIMVDSDKEYNTSILPDVDLFLQRKTGYFEKDIGHGSRGRIIHKNEHGNYSLGRHDSYTPYFADDYLLILWFGLSPYPYIEQRKLQIQNRIPEKHKKSGIGIEHLQTKESLYNNFKSTQTISYDLFTKGIYSCVLNKFIEYFNLKYHFIQ